MTEDELADMLAKEYEADISEVKGDTSAFVESLKNAGLIED